MKIKLLNIFIVVFIAISILALTGCNSKEDKAEDTIRGFIDKHYVADKIDLEEFEEYVKNGSGIGYNLDKKDKEFAEYMTEKAFNNYIMDRYIFNRFKLLYEKNCTAEIKDLEITEKEKSEDMRRFNVKFNWIIKNDKEEIVEEHKVGKDMYLSKENGQWLINQYNRFEILYDNFNMG
ncbi:hypothetical protein [Clostridium sp. UBA7503]|uniref:hypothetical protein n=1 Tax=Clostridium sp. UBA7503 TaxID=1946377 RepID=UPI003216EE2F